MTLCAYSDGDQNLQHVSVLPPSGQIINFCRFIDTGKQHKLQYS